MSDEPPLQKCPHCGFTIFDPDLRRCEECGRVLPDKPDVFKETFAKPDFETRAEEPAAAPVDTASAESESDYGFWALVLRGLVYLVLLGLFSKLLGPVGGVLALLLSGMLGKGSYLANIGHTLLGVFALMVVLVIVGFVVGSIICAGIR